MKKATLTDAGEPAVLDTDTGEVRLIEQKYTTVLRDAQPWKTPFNHDTDHESLSTGLTCRDPSKTQQQFASDADINNILAKFLKTGEPPAMTGPARYLDIGEEADLQDVIVTAHEVQEAWDTLPQAAKDLLGSPARFTTYVESAIARGDIEALERIDLVKPKEKAPEPQTPPGGTPAPAGETPPKTA